MKTPQGVRKINENVLQEKRALILTDENKDNYNFTDLPDGTIYIDTISGNEYIKLKGQSDWLPRNVKNDNTIVIMKDSMIINETYTIKSIDKSAGTFVYITDTDQQRTGIINEQGYLVFRLDKGTYLPGRNHLKIDIDGVLERSVAAGNLIEISEYRFCVTDELEVGHVINVEYIQWIRIGNPYPRIFINNTEPESAEVGDIWIDGDATLADGDDDASEDFTESSKINWNRITGTPTSLIGYGIKSPQYSTVGHGHVWLDITDRPESLPANGGNAATVDNRTPGIGPNNIAVLDELGCIAPSMLPSQFLIKSGAIYIQEEKPSVVVDKSLWVCTKKDDPHIEVYVNYAWLRLG